MNFLAFKSLRLFGKGRKLLLGASTMSAFVATASATHKSIFDFEATDIGGSKVALSKYKGNVVLVVNVASKWGATKTSYTELQQLYEKYHDQGFEIFGFPCNQFASQEPGTEQEIKQFVKTKYGITFPMFAKVDVNGDKAHPLWLYLQTAKGGFLGDAIKWNYTKFLCDRDGIPVERYATTSNPLSFEKDIQELLKKSHL